MDDKLLCKGLAKDLDGTFEELVLTYQDRLYRFALRLTGSPQDAEEVTQDALVRAHQALTGYPARRIMDLGLRPWLYQIVLNVFRNRVRKRRLATDPIDGELPLIDRDPLPEEVVEREEQVAWLATALLRLSPRHREAVVLRHIEDLSYTEMAKILGQPEGTIKSNVHRGIEDLRSVLMEQRSEVPA